MIHILTISLPINQNLSVLTISIMAFIYPDNGIFHHSTMESAAMFVINPFFFPILLLILNGLRIQLTSLQT